MSLRNIKMAPYILEIPTATNLGSSSLWIGFVMLCFDNFSIPFVVISFYGLATIFHKCIEAPDDFTKFFALKTGNGNFNLVTDNIEK